MPSIEFCLDAHVHFYSEWEITLDQLLTTCLENITASNQGSAVYPAIFLLKTGKTETHHKNFPDFSSLKEWSVQKNPEEICSYHCSHKLGDMLLFTGTQYNSAEGLEVLVVGSQGNTQQGMPIEQMLDSQSGRLNIIPWAVGKWMGKRGDIVTHLLNNMSDTHRFILGDNGGRPRLWNIIPQFKYAETKGIPILAGSDPLPLSCQYTQSGTYGSRIHTDIDFETPWASLLDTLNHQPEYQTFGQRSTLTRFVGNQLRLRL